MADDRRTAGELLPWAILQTVAYADVFDYPLTLAELHRYLVGVAASPAEVARVVSAHPVCRERLEEAEGFYTLAGRTALVACRQRRTAHAAALWPLARQYGRQVASLPFVRLVAVTGALAVNNVEPGADIDFMIGVEPGRLWLCRALIILLVRRIQRSGGPTLCPNYLLSTGNIRLQEHNLFTAHELVQMVPLHGFPLYRQLRRLNRWSDRYLPNAAGPPAALRPVSAVNGWPRQLLETGLRLPLFNRLEQWEMNRKIRKLTATAADGAEICFTPDCCKGHFGAYGRRTLAAFEARLQEWRIPCPSI